MPKVTIHKAGETPSEKIIKAATDRTVVTDERGRTIEVRKMTPLDRMRMSRAAGPENATNQPYMIYALVACSTASIDGDEMVTPQNQVQLEAAISRLGEEGYEAVLNAVVGFYSDSGEKDMVEEAKN